MFNNFKNKQTKKMGDVGSGLKFHMGSATCCVSLL